MTPGAVMFDISTANRDAYIFTRFATAGVQISFLACNHVRCNYLPSPPHIVVIQAKFL